MKSDISRSQKVIEFNKKTQTTTSLIFVSRPRCLKGFSAWEEKAIFNFILFLKIRSFDEWVQEIVEVSELCEIRGSGNKNYARNSFFFSVLCKKDFERLDWELWCQVLCWTHGKLQEFSCAGETLPDQVNSFLVSQADQSVTVDSDNLHPGLRRNMNILSVATNDVMFACTNWSITNILWNLFYLCTLFHGTISNLLPKCCSSPMLCWSLAHAVPPLVGLPNWSLLLVASWLDIHVTKCKLTLAKREMQIIFAESGPVRGQSAPCNIIARLSVCACSLHKCKSFKQQFEWRLHVTSCPKLLVACPVLSGRGRPLPASWFQFSVRESFVYALALRSAWLWSPTMCPDRLNGFDCSLELVS